MVTTDMATSTSSSAWVTSTCGKQSTHGLHVEVADSVERPCRCDACRRAAWAYDEPWMAASSSITASMSCNRGFCDVALWRPLLRRHGDGTSKIFRATIHRSTPVFYSRRGARRPAPSKSSVHSFDLARATRCCVQHRPLLDGIWRLPAICVI
jgi:hypothetical protein